MKQRVAIIDYIRVLAIILMIFFHTSYDLSLFNYLQINFKTMPFWHYLPRIIVTLFFLAAGASLYLVHGIQGIQWPNLWKRQAKLLLSALTVTVSTYFLFPQSWIYFGTLHSLFVCTFFSLPFLFWPRLSAPIGIILLIPAVFFGVKYPWPLFNHFSMDYIPALPWVGVMWVGITFGYFLERYPHSFLTKIPPPSWPVKFMSKHSLVIYLVHQPIIYGLVLLISSLR